MYRPSHSLHLQLTQVLEEVNDQFESLSPNRPKMKLIEEQLSAMSTAVIIMEGMEGNDEYRESLSMSPKAFYERCHGMLKEVFGVENEGKIPYTNQVEEKLLTNTFSLAHETVWNLLSI